MQIATERSTQTIHGFRNALAPPGVWPRRGQTGRGHMCRQGTGGSCALTTHRKLVSQGDFAPSVAFQQGLARALSGLAK
jgi:hypothetical protein